MTGTLSLWDLPSSESSAFNVTVFQPWRDFTLKPSPRSAYPSSDTAHSRSSAGDLVPRIDCENTNPSPPATAPAMLSEQFMPLSATTTTRSRPKSRFMSASTGIIVRQSAVLPGKSL